MTNLVCNVNTCTHNANNLCNKDGIEIGGNGAVSCTSTCCESYEEKSGAFTSSYEAPKYCLNVTCEAKNCTYNNCRMCEAEAISIEGGSVSSEAETKCASFVPKL